MDDLASSLRFSALAERLLAHRLAQPDLAAQADGVRLGAAFRSLAKVFALEHAVAAGQPSREILSVLAEGLVEAMQATSCRVLLKSAEGALFLAHATTDDPFTGDVLAGQTAPAVADGRSLILELGAGARRLSLACAPLRRRDGEILGAMQLLE